MGRRGCRRPPGRWYLFQGAPRPHRAPRRCSGGPPAANCDRVVLGCGLARRVGLTYLQRGRRQTAAGRRRALHPLPNHGQGQRLGAPLLPAGMETGGWGSPPPGGQQGAGQPDPNDGSTLPYARCRKRTKAVSAAEARVCMLWWCLGL